MIIIILPATIAISGYPPIFRQNQVYNGGKHYNHYRTRLVYCTNILPEFGKAERQRFGEYGAHACR